MLKDHIIQSPQTRVWRNMEIAILINKDYLNFVQESYMNGKDHKKYEYELNTATRAQNKDLRSKK